MKKTLILIFLLSIPFVFATPLDITLDLETREYGPRQSFEGDIVINYTGNISINEELEARIRNGGTNYYYAKISDLIDSSYTVNRESYEAISSNSNLTVEGSPFYFGILLDDEVNTAEFEIEGMEANGNFPNNVFLDIGNDQEIEWQYSGAFRQWSNPFYGNGMDGDETPIGDVVLKGSDSRGKCNELNLTFNEMLNSTRMQINVKATKNRDGSNLMASVDGPDFSGECDLSEPGSSLQEVSCELENDEPENGDYEICVFTSDGDININYYQLPRIRISGDDDYFISAKLAEYETELRGRTTIDANFLTDALNNYYNDFCEGTCIIPISIHKDNGEIELSNLYTEDVEGRTVNSFSTLRYKEKELVIQREVRFPLIKFPSLKTPSEKEDYRLRIKFRGEDDEKQFSVVDAPVAVIRVNRRSVAQGEGIVFNGEGSHSPNGEIISWKWDFGDNTTSDGEIVNHIYSREGVYTVTLRAKDETGLQGSNTITMSVGNLEEHLDDILNDTLVKIDQARSYIGNATSLVKETSILLKYSSYIESVRTNVSNLILDYENIRDSDSSESIKERRYLEILEDVEAIKKEVPLQLRVRQFTFENIFLKKEDIPDPNLFKEFSSEEEKSLYLIKAYDFNFNHVTVNLDARDVDVTFLSGDSEHFTLVKKEIKVQGGENNLLVEDLRNIVNYNDDVVSLTPDSEISNRILSWPIQREKEILYLLKNIELEETKNAVTAVFSDIEIENPEVEIAVECGNDICEYNEEFLIYENDPENEYYCKKDCRKEFPLWIGIVLGIILIVGVYFFNFYTGPGSLKRRAPETKEKIQDIDMIRLRTYIQESLDRGFTKEDIANALLEKGWDKKYVDEGFKGLG